MDNEMPNETLAHMLRAMAWRRALGELQSLRETYYGREEMDKLEVFDEAYSAFTIRVEEEGLVE